MEGSHRDQTFVIRVALFDRGTVADRPADRPPSTAHLRLHRSVEQLVAATVAHHVHHRADGVGDLVASLAEEVGIDRTLDERIRRDRDRAVIAESGQRRCGRLVGQQYDVAAFEPHAGRRRGPDPDQRVFLAPASADGVIGDGSGGQGRTLDLLAVGDQAVFVLEAHDERELSDLLDDHEWSILRSGCGSVAAGRPGLFEAIAVDLLQLVVIVRHGLLPFVVDTATQPRERQRNVIDGRVASVSFICGMRVR